jgi:LysR family transcriptional regulator, glycine cleavage system transcriptional activator
LDFCASIADFVEPRVGRRITYRRWYANVNNMRPIQLPPMNTLHTFAVAARRLSFSQASEDLNLTHAAVSMQIKKLEDWFGQRLFERTSRGLLLTDAGRELLSCVDSALSTIATTSQRLRLTRETRSISVACLPSVAACWLVPGLADFLSQYPDVSVEISYAEALKPFNSDYHDVLISHMTSAPEGLVSRRLFGRTRKPVASPAYLKRNLATIQNRLDGARLLHDASMSGWEDWFQAAGFRPSRISHGPVYPDFDLLVVAVLAGDGVALCPVEVFRKEIERGDIVVLSDVATQIEESYYIISAVRCPQAVSNFIRWFEARCAS